MFELYCAHFAISIDDLRGKRILDLGSGYGQFARDCARRGIHDVYSLDCDSELFELTWGTRRMMRDGRTVFAQAEALPFRDETFDLVLAHYSVPAYLTSCAAVHAVFQEICRVLARGGEARIVPWKPSLACDECIDEAVQKLQSDPAYSVITKVVATPEAAYGRLIERDLLIIQKR